jgi:hypothetical protein
VSKIETPANADIETIAANGSPDLGILRDAALDTVSGGFIGAPGDSGVLAQIVPPRDPASGLPTGK